MNFNRQILSSISDQVHEEQSQHQSSNWLNPDKIKEMQATCQNFTRLLETVNLHPTKPETGIVQKFCGVREKWNLPAGVIQGFLNKRLQGILKTKRIKSNWNKQDNLLLLWILEHFCHIQKIQNVQSIEIGQWEQISKCIPGTTSESCMFRILSFKKTKLSQKKWGQNEDKILKQIVKQKQKNEWRTVAQQLYKLNPDINKIYRNSKQCKQHWNCYLNPELKKGPWDLIEDINLLQFIYENECKKTWAKLAQNFDGRTQNALKNRYSFLLSNEYSEYSSGLCEMDQIKYILRRLYAIKKKQKVPRKIVNVVDIIDEQNGRGPINEGGTNIQQDNKTEHKVQGAPKVEQNIQNFIAMGSKNTVPMFYFFFGGNFM